MSLHLERKVGGGSRITNQLVDGKWNKTAENGGGIAIEEKKGRVSCSFNTVDTIPNDQAVAAEKFNSCKVVWMETEDCVITATEHVWGFQHKLWRNQEVY